MFMLIINRMEEDLKTKAKNYYMIACIAEKLGMCSESASNFFKALFAADDFIIAKIGERPKDHTERFRILKLRFPELYIITDKLFSAYRRTYTQELKKEELELVKKRIKDAFKNTNIEIPTDKEIKEKLTELVKKGKILG